MSRIMNFQVDDDIREKIKKRAKQLGVSQGAYIRMLILKDN